MLQQHTTPASILTSRVRSATLPTQRSEGVRPLARRVLDGDARCFGYAWIEALRAWSTRGEAVKLFALIECAEGVLMARVEHAGGPRARFELRCYATRAEALTHRAELSAGEGTYGLVTNVALLAQGHDEGGEDAKTRRHTSETASFRARALHRTSMVSDAFVQQAYGDALLRGRLFAGAAAELLEAELFSLCASGPDQTARH